MGLRLIYPKQLRQDLEEWAAPRSSGCSAAWLPFGIFFARVSFRHMQGKEEAENWKEIVRQGLPVIYQAPENLHQFVQGLRLLKWEEMTDEKLREVWRFFPQIGNGVLGQIMARYVAHEEPSLYGFLQAGTATFWHRERMTSADFQNNNLFVTQLLRYAFERQN